MAANPFAPSVQTHTQAVGGASETLVDANPARSSIMIQPQTEDVYVNFGSTVGKQATGTLQFDANPSDGETLTINGDTFTFVNVVTNPLDEVQIGLTADATRDALLTVLQSSADANIIVASYSSTVVSGDPGIQITFINGGTGGNSYTLADSSSASVLRSAATLTGGAATGNGVLLPLNTIAFFSAGEYPSVREAVYIVSASTSAETVYLEGIAAG